MSLDVFRRVAVAGVGVIAATSLVSCSSAESKADADVKKVEKSLHADVTKAYDDSKSTLDHAADKIGDGSRTFYDKAKNDLESLGGDLDDASSRAGHDAETAYRDVEHKVEKMDRDVDHHLRDAGGDIDDAETTAWHDVKDGYHRVKNSIDHAIDQVD